MIDFPGQDKPAHLPTGEQGWIHLNLLCDPHHPGALERLRGSDFEFRGLASAQARRWAWLWRHYVWKRDNFAHQHLLEHWASHVRPEEWVVLGGDYSCDSAFIGLEDPASRASARECLEVVTSTPARGYLAIAGDHEYGKPILDGSRGGIRWASFEVTHRELGIPMHFHARAGIYHLVGISSSLLTFTLHEKEARPEDSIRFREAGRNQADWLEALCQSLQPEDRILLFCHDPTALAYLGRFPWATKLIYHLEQTFCGHLHSEWFGRMARSLCWLPQVRCMGPSIHRISLSLRRARHWSPFRVRIAPALSGIELAQDGGFLRIRLDPTGQAPLRIDRVRWRDQILSEPNA